MPTNLEILYETYDEFGKIQVIEQADCRKLLFDSDVEQGCQFLHAPLQLAYEYQENILQQIADWQTAQQIANQPIRILMLGLGSGALVQHLLHCGNRTLTIVELRQSVIDCAQDFFQLPDEPEVEIVQADAIEFASQPQEYYDIVIVDIFDAHGEANSLSDTQFLASLWNLTAPQGLLIFNLWQAWKERQEKPSSDTHINSNAMLSEATPESQKVIDFWHALSLKKPSSMKTDNAELKPIVNRYNIASTQNIILTVLKPFI